MGLLEGLDAGAIGESFGDYFAVSVGLAAADRYIWPVAAERPCPMDWDASSYTAAPALDPALRRRPDRQDALRQHPRRRPDLEPGAVGIRLGYVALGEITAAARDTSLILSQFDYAADTTWQAAARATYLVAQARDGQVAADLVREKFAARGIVFTV